MVLVQTFSVLDPRRDSVSCLLETQGNVDALRSCGFKLQNEWALLWLPEKFAGGAKRRRLYIRLGWIACPAFYFPNRLYIYA